MITFSALGKHGIRCEIGKKVISVYPENIPAKDGSLALASLPEKEPQNGVVSWPGEYDIEGISIRGIGHDEGRQVSFVMTGEGVRCAFLSSPLIPLNDNELEQMGNIDVLFIPTGDTKVVQKLIDEIDPRVLFPLLDGDAKTNEEFLKIAGVKDQEVVPEYKLKGALPAEGREVVLLKS